MLILIVGALEGILRFTGYGGFPPTIQKLDATEAGRIMTTSPAGPYSYFFAGSGYGTNNSYTFLSPKPANTTRILLCGASVIQGFPQPPAFAPSAFLEEMLEDVWPDRDVEIINLGATAVASFPVLEMVAESFDHEPDLVVVYCGHNEFFGAYGVASLHRAGLSPWSIWLHRRLLSMAIPQWLAASFASKPSGSSAVLMEEMVGKSRVDHDDPLRDHAARNLYAHVSEIIRRCTSRGIPVIVCTLPSNERDIAPFGEDDVSEYDRDTKQEILTALDIGRESRIADVAARIAQLERVARSCPTHARLQFELGGAYHAAGEFDSASKAFCKAVDLDPMPWRAPTKSRDAVRRAAADGGATLCDVRRVFRTASPSGSIGWELMSDHVHPSLRGQDLLARALVETLTGFEGALAVDRSAYDALPDWQAYAKRLGDNPFTRFNVAHTLRRLCNISFYKRSNPGAFERFDTQAAELESPMSPSAKRMANSWQNPRIHVGGKRPLSGMVAQALLREDKHAEAESLLDVAARCVPLYSDWHLKYTYQRLLCRSKIRGALDPARRTEAIEAIARGRTMLRKARISTGHAERYLGGLHLLLDEPADSIPYLREARAKLRQLNRVGADHDLMRAYAKTGKARQARAIATEGIRRGGQFAASYRRFLAEISAGATQPP